MHKPIHSFFKFAVLLGLLLTLTGTASAAPPATRAKWTVMVYISGDNNLEDFVVPDIETELAPTGSGANVQVVALADQDSKHVSFFRNLHRIPHKLLETEYPIHTRNRPAIFDTTKFTAARKNSPSRMRLKV